MGLDEGVSARAPALQRVLPPLLLLPHSCSLFCDPVLHFTSSTPLNSTHPRPAGSCSRACCSRA